MNIIKFINQFLERIFSFLTSKWASAVIILGVVGIFGYAFKLEIDHKKATGFLDVDFWLDNLVPNIMADMLGILLTSFIIAGLFSQNHKLNEDKQLYKLVASDYNKLILTLGRSYLNLLSKDYESPSYSFRNKELKKSLKNIQKRLKTKDDFSYLFGPFRIEDNDVYEFEFFLAGSEFLKRVPKVRVYLERLHANNGKFDALLDMLYENDQKMEEIELEKGKESSYYKAKVSESEEISAMIDKIRVEEAEILQERDNLKSISFIEAMDGLIEYFKDEVGQFYDKYNFIIPMDMRLSFSNIEKKLEILKRHSQDYYFNGYPKRKNPISSASQKRKDKTDEYCITLISDTTEQILNLLNYFNKV